MRERFGMAMTFGYAYDTGFPPRLQMCKPATPPG
jgi:hypothetical protein